MNDNDDEDTEIHVTMTCTAADLGGEGVGKHSTPFPPATAATQANDDNLS